jgi:hypothetical protein
MRVAACVVVLAACAGPRHGSRASEPHPYAFNFVPFGVGQLENGEPGKALAFALVETATAATSAGLYLHIEHLYPDGLVPAAEAGHARTLQQLEIGSGVMFFGVAAWGVIDAITRWHPAVEVAPAPIAGGAGLALGWSF